MHKIYNLDKLETTGEGGIRRHLPGDQDRPILNWVPHDYEEALLIKQIRATTHTLTITGNEATVKHNALHQ